MKIQVRFYHYVYVAAVSAMMLTLTGCAHSQRVPSNSSRSTIILESVTPNLTDVQAEEVIGVLQRRIKICAVEQPSVMRDGEKFVVEYLSSARKADKVVRDLIELANLEFIYLKNVQSQKNPGAAIRMETPEDSSKPYTFYDSKNRPVPVSTVIDRNRPALLSAKDLKSNARGDIQRMQSVVNIEFNDQGKLRFAEFTRAHAREYLAIVLNDRILSVPMIVEPILSGHAQISGSFTPASAQKLADTLNAGPLPVALKVVSITP
jgi:preprotein translocase subunit SecD